ncbi:hypothetical protein FS749_000494 [Ceratobasidium sp. UAMH 11750]|nr:hypothetical protein FS749_000494 [Ceratobasidium sp. UAMH 11750]
MSVTPGTYRIVSEGSGTAMTAPDWNGWDVVCWHKHDGKNQQWFVQRSGLGYSIKNCATGHYLAVSRMEEVTPVYCGRYPTTWVLNQEHGGIHTMKCGDNDNIIDLDDWGKGHDGNHMHLYRGGNWMVHRRWWFERLSDDSGEEEPRLRREIDSNKQQISNLNQQLAEHKTQLADREKQLADKDSQIAQITERLTTQEQEVVQIKNELTQKLAMLIETQEALHRANESIESQRAEVARIQTESTNDQLGRDLAHQKEETDSLRNKMENFERLFSQMMKRPNNMA